MGSGTQRDIRHTVAALLRHPARTNRLFTADAIAHLLNIALSIEDDVRTKFETTDVVKAISGGEDEAVLSYSDLGFGDDRCILYYRRERVGRSKRYYYIGRFQSDKDGRAAAVEKEPPPLCIIPRPSIETLTLYLDKKKSKPALDDGSRDVVPRIDLEAALQKIKQLEMQIESNDKPESSRSVRKRPASPNAEVSTSSRRKKVLQMRFIIEGEAGVIGIDPSQSSIDVQSLLSSINKTHLSQDDLQNDSAEKRKSMSYAIKRINKVDVFVPVGTDVLLKNELSKIRSKAAKIDRLYSFFGHQQCVYKDESKRVITLFAQANTGGSDQATALLIGASWKVLSIELGLNLTPAQIASATPSQTTLINWEYKTAAESYLKLAKELEGKPYALSQDGAHKLGCDHLIKTITFYHNGALKHICVDADACGKTTEGIADALIKTLERLQKYAPGSRCIAVEGDSGSSGAIQAVFPVLIEKGFLDVWACMIRCLLHAKAKCYERAIIGAFGQQGRGMDTCMQLLYSTMAMCRKLIKDSGGKHSLFDEYYHKAIEKILNDPAWQGEAEQILKDSYHDLMEVLNNDEIGEQLEEFMTSPRGLQLPLATRWQSTIPMLRIYIKLHVVFYFMAVEVTQAEKSHKHLHKVAADTIRLIKIRTGGAPPSPDNVSPLIVQLKFIHGFAESGFSNFFTMSCREDPRVGLPGYISGKFVERNYLMKEWILRLKSEDGIKNDPAFESYLKAKEKVPVEGEIESGNRESFDKMEKVFLDEFDSAYDVHVDSVWREQKILVYILAGNCELARAFARWLHHSEESEGAADEDGNVSQYQFEDRDIDVSGHQMDGSTMKVNIRKCMEYLTARARANEILEDPLIKECKRERLMLASSSHAVDLFNKNTWDGFDYSPMVGMINTKIDIHPAQNQGVESYVYSTKCIRKTNIGEDRTSAALLLHSTTIRPYNKHSLQVKTERVRKEREAAAMEEQSELRQQQQSNEEQIAADLSSSSSDECSIPELSDSESPSIPDPQEISPPQQHLPIAKAKQHPKIQKTKDAERVAGFCDMCDNFTRAITSIEKPDPTAFLRLRQEVVKDMKNPKARQSYIEIQKEIEHVKQANAKEVRTVYAAEAPTGGIHVTAAVGGRVRLSSLRKGAGDEPAVDKEIEKRGIKLSKSLNEYTWKDKMDLLRGDELSILARSNKHFNQDGTAKLYTDVQDIIPSSQELIALIPELSDRIAARTANRRR